MLTSPYAFRNFHPRTASQDDLSSNLFLAETYWNRCRFDESWLALFLAAESGEI